jgi:hypothetical protein
MGRRQSSSNAFGLNPNKPRVPHISLVFREMWDTTAPNRKR